MRRIGGDVVSVTYEQLDEGQLLSDLKRAYAGLITLREQFRKCDDLDHLRFVQSELDAVRVMHSRAESGMGCRIWDLEMADLRRNKVIDGGTS